MRQEITNSGFSALELIIVLALLGILSALAIPRLPELGSAFDQMNARSVFVQDLKQAQAEALTRGCRGIFTIAADQGSYTFGCDYLAYDTNSPPVADVATLHRVLPRGVTITTSSQIIFNSRGQSVDENDVLSNVTVTLYREDGAENVPFRTGTLLGTGLFSYETFDESEEEELS